MLLQQPRGAPTAVALQRELSALAGSMAPGGALGSKPAVPAAPASQAGPSTTLPAVAHASSPAQAARKEGVPQALPQKRKELEQGDVEEGPAPQKQRSAQALSTGGLPNGCANNGCPAPP